MEFSSDFHQTMPCSFIVVVAVVVSGDVPLHCLIV